MKSTLRVILRRKRSSMRKRKKGKLWKCSNSVNQLLTVFYLHLIKLVSEVATENLHLIFCIKYMNWL
jgi:hypothetical protein